MATDVVDAEVVEMPPERAVVVVPPVGLAAAVGPDGMIALASQMATALRDIVEHQKLYALIQGKKYPTVEAWMTIARMDNVVARELVGGTVRHEDGSYESTVELVRLSDGFVVGRGSSVCGSPDDKPWCNRAEYARRSMAVTRATSRAFRQQYSWIMSLAGYEPTPADEMPTAERTDVDRETGEIRHPVASAPPEPEVPWSEGSVTLTGASLLNPTSGMDGEIRETPEGMRLGFALALDATRKVPQVVAFGKLAQDIHDAIGNNGRNLDGLKVTLTGEMFRVPWRKEGRQMPPFQRLILSRVETASWTLPAPETVASQAAERVAAKRAERVAGTCGNVAADGLMAGAVCTEPPHDTGPHKSDAGSWPA